MAVNIHIYYYCINLGPRINVARMLPFPLNPPTCTHTRHPHTYTPPTHTHRHLNTHTHTHTHTYIYIYIYMAVDTRMAVTEHRICFNDFSFSTVCHTHKAYNTQVTVADIWPLLPSSLWWSWRCVCVCVCVCVSRGGGGGVLESPCWTWNLHVQKNSLGHGACISFRHGASSSSLHPQHVGTNLDLWSVIFFTTLHSYIPEHVSGTFQGNWVFICGILKKGYSGWTLSPSLSLLLSLSLSLLQIRWRWNKQVDLRFF